MLKILKVLLPVICFTLASCMGGREMKELNLSFDVDTAQGQVNKKNIEQTIDVLAKRFDKLGIDDVKIDIDEKTGKLAIKLKTEQTPEYITRLVCTKGDFSIWETYGNTDFAPYMQKANDELAKLVANGHPVKDELRTMNDTAGKHFAMENPLYFLLSPNTMQDEEGRRLYAPGSGIGITLRGDRPRVDKMLQVAEVDILIPQDVKFMWAAKPMADSNMYSLYAIKMGITGEPAIGAGSITDARIDTDNNVDGKYVVNFQFKPDYVPVWERITRDNMGKGLAIVIDNKVYSCPMVAGPIPNGNCEIAGDMDKPEALFLATIMKNGALGLGYKPSK